MRTTLCALAACGALLVGSATPALAAAHDPQRPAGPVVSVVPSDNGGDNGWGNCGHNSSGGNPHSDPAGGGNGGYHKGDACRVVEEAPVANVPPVAPIAPVAPVVDDTVYA